MVAARPVLVVDVGESLDQAIEARRIVEIQSLIGDVLCERAPGVLVERLDAAETLERLVDLGPERLIVVWPSTDGQQHELVRQEVGPPQLVEGRDDLAMGEIAGGPEQDQDRRVRDALQPKPFAQDVGDRLRARGALALAERAGAPSSSTARPWAAGPAAPGSSPPAQRAAAPRPRPGQGPSAWPWSAAGSSPRSGRYSVLTSWPPNSLRSAASTLAPSESSWRDRKRVSSERVMTGAGTSWSMASWMVQRPSPKSAT